MWTTATRRPHRTRRWPASGWAGSSAPNSSAEFPQQYGPEQQAKAKAAPKHPAEQLQHFLNLLGKEGWELTTTTQVGQLLMFFFKRPLRPLPKQLPAAETKKDP